MLSNSFKSKARNIAIKSFFQEMKNRGWYMPIVIGSIGVLKSIKGTAENASDIVDKFMQSLNAMKYESISLFSKKPFEDLEKCIMGQIEKNFQSFHRKDDEYEYLVNCVNTCIQLFIENGIYRWSDEGIKKVRFEEIGESIFVRAAKKIFGKDFKLEEDPNRGKNGRVDIDPSNLSDRDKKFLNERITNYLRGGYDQMTAVGKAFADLSTIKSTKIAQPLEPFLDEEPRFIAREYNEYEVPYDFDDEDLFWDEDD